MITPEQDDKLIAALASINGQRTARRYAILRRVVNQIVAEQVAVSERMAGDYRRLVVAGRSQTQRRLLKAA